MFSKFIATMSYSVHCTLLLGNLHRLRVLAVLNLSSAGKCLETSRVGSYPNYQKLFFLLRNLHSLLQSAHPSLQPHGLLFTYSLNSDISLSLSTSIYNKPLHLCCIELFVVIPLKFLMTLKVPVRQESSLIFLLPPQSVARG